MIMAGATKLDGRASTKRWDRWCNGMGVQWNGSTMVYWYGCQWGATFDPVLVSDNEKSGDGIRINNIISGISLILVGFTIIIDS